jgi:uncharacterized protein (TIGR03437 family)
VKKFCAALSLLVLYVSAPALLLAQPDRIAGAIGEGRTAARGVVHPLAQPRYDQGPVEGSLRLPYIQMILTPAAEQQAARDQLLAAQQNPSSPEFRRWLTPEQYADRFGVSRSDVAMIVQWLSSAGFSIEYTAHARNWIAFSGTAAQVQAAFHTTVHRYLVNGETHYAVSSDPLLPEAIAPLVGTFLGLHDFNPKSRISPADTSMNGLTHSLAPGDLATIYNINPLYQQGIDGTGQKIVIVGQSDLNVSDIQTFRATYGLNTANIQTILGGAEPGVVASNSQEADLDVEWAGAIARNAQLIYVYATNASAAATFAIDQNLAPIISESFGGCETEEPASVFQAFENIAKQGNSQGITWLASSGDSGAADCDLRTAGAATGGLAVNFPASVPEVTAVGGTEFNEGRANYWKAANGPNGGSALSYIPETAWNDNVYGTNNNFAVNLNATGGGVSTSYSKPAWQTGPGVPADGHRDVPDVALAGAIQHDAYNVVSGGQATLVGGTSAATPAFAGIVALLNQYVKGQGLGNLNALLYPLAASSPAAFHDIVTGNNIVPCQPKSANCVNGQLGYSAAPGYDLATGLGSVDVYNLVTGWNGPPASGAAVSSLSPSSAAAGGAAFTLTVNGSNFASAAVVEWNGTALQTAFVSATQLTATVSANLIAVAGTAAISVSSGAATTGPLYFTAIPPALSVSEQRITTQPLPASGCPVPPAVTFFATDMTAYVYFAASNVSTNDLLTSAWLAPDGTTIESGSWAVDTPGSYCFSSGAPRRLSLSNVTASQLGTWFGRVYDNGTLVFSIEFTVSCGMSAPPSISSIDSASAYGGYPYFASGSWLEIKGTNLADSPDPRLTAATNPGQWTGSDFSGANAPTALDGISVSIDSKPAYVWYLSTGQLNVQAPEDTATGNVSITVSTCRGTSQPFQFARQALAPGLLAPPSFMVNGTQYLVAQFASDYAYVLSASAGASLGVNSRPAKPGDLIIAYGIGFGDVTPSILPGVTVAQANALVDPVTFSFGSANATLSYYGLAPNFVGLYEFYITVPPGLANGDYQINVTQNGTKVPQTFYLTVHN